MNEIIAPLSVLGVLCTSQSVLSTSISAALEFSYIVLIISCTIVLLLSNKIPKRSQVISLKTLIRGLVIGVTTTFWGWSIIRIGSARSVLLDITLVVLLSCISEKKKDITLLSLCGLCCVMLMVSSESWIAIPLAATSIIVREMFHLFKDIPSVGTGGLLCLVCAFVLHFVFPLNSRSLVEDSTSHKSTSLRWLLASALLWIAPSALLSVQEEKWYEYSQNKKNRVVFGLSCVALISVLQKDLHTISFFTAIILAIALVIKRKTKAERSFLPTSVKDGTSRSLDVDQIKKSITIASPFPFHVSQHTFAQFIRFFREAHADKDSRSILYFLSINFSFMFVEIVVGLYTGSLGLISDAGHMFFDNAALFIGLFAAFASKWRPDQTYTYGYGRYETIAGFVNGIFLTFVAVFVLTESLERFSEPPEIRTEGLLLTSVLGLCVNGVGLVFFHEHAHSHGGDSHAHSHAPKMSTHDHGHSHGGSKCNGSHGHSHHDGEEEEGSSHGHSHYEGSHGSHTNENMHGVFLHVLADALGSVGVIISSLLIQYKGWYIADPICSFCISVLIFVSVLPLIKSTASSLMLRVPVDSERKFEACIERCKRRPGVVRVVRAHLWRHSKDTLVATVNVTVSTQDAQDAVMVWLISTLKNDVGATDVTVQVCTEGVNRDLSK